MQKSKQKGDYGRPWTHRPDDRYPYNTLTQTKLLPSCSRVFRFALTYAALRCHPPSLSRYALIPSPFLLSFIRSVPVRIGRRKLRFGSHSVRFATVMGATPATVSG